jgi:hypothetical protein
VVALAGIVVVAGQADAQADRRERRWQLEARADALIARTTAFHAGFGANLVTGTYVRAGVLGAAGVRSVDQELRESGRLDAFARFHVDPFREFPGAVYVTGGATVLFDSGTDPRVRGIFGVGVEGRAWSGRWIPGLEIGIGGGVRIGATLRKARSGGR